MSATTERRESTGIVAETLRRPIEDAVREGVKEALEEQAAVARERSGGRSGDGGGAGGGKFALLVLLGVGVAAFLLWRRRSGTSEPGGTDSTTESIRSRSKTSRSGPSGSIGQVSGSGEPGSDDTDAEMTDESVENEDTAPEASNE